MLAGSGFGPYNTVPKGLTTVDIGIYPNSLLFFKSVFIALVISEETTKPNFLLRESFLIIFFTCSEILILYLIPFLSSSISIIPPCTAF